MTVHGCPVCELRFRTKNERDWHLREEHGSHRVHHPEAAVDPAAGFRLKHEVTESAPDEEGT